VLCICTPEYKRRKEGRVQAEVGKGVFWEGNLIYNYLYDEKGNPPVRFPGGVMIFPAFKLKNARNRDVRRCMMPHEDLNGPNFWCRYRLWYRRLS
jgi:hypothetical protein